MSARIGARCAKCNWARDEFAIEDRKWALLGAGALVLLGILIAFQHYVNAT